MNLKVCDLLKGQGQSEQTYHIDSRCNSVKGKPKRSFFFFDAKNCNVCADEQKVSSQLQAYLFLADLLINCFVHFHCEESPT
jgi:hypothetical protein